MTPLEHFLVLAALWALVGLSYLLGRLIIARRRRLRSEDADIEAVAQAIARCYGHGPLRVMDPHYQHEFRRDARAALAAMRRR